MHPKWQNQRCTHKINHCNIVCGVGQKNSILDQVLQLLRQHILQHIDASKCDSAAMFFDELVNIKAIKRAYKYTLLAWACLNYKRCFPWYFCPSDDQWIRRSYHPLIHHHKPTQGCQIHLDLHEALSTSIAKAMKCEKESSHYYIECLYNKMHITCKIVSRKRHTWESIAKCNESKWKTRSQYNLLPTSWDFHSSSSGLLNSRVRHVHNVVYDSWSIRMTSHTEAMH